MSAKSSIQVCIKLRPCEPELVPVWQVKDKRSIQLIDSQTDPCVFDYVFDQDCTNQEVFDCMAKHIVEACIKGFNGTIFAYGQTSSGKTYTMMGDSENPGVMILAAKEIFKQIAKQTDRDFLLRVGYIEIYNEKIFDLLNKKNQDLKIHESSGMVNVNCEECIITCEEDLLRFLLVGNKERTVGETLMNERSSRSHAIFRIIIESRKTDRSEDDAVIQSILNLVDLAGSERADQTGARGTRLKEGSHINKSLHFLSNVIKSLSENEDNKYICFRDSKLTRILQASLGGNAFTSIICNVRPTIMDESQSTLNFAMRAKKIRVKPQLNEIVSDATMMKRLEREIKDLKDRLAEEQARNESQLKVRLLEQRIKTDTLKIITSNTISDKRKNRRRTWCPGAPAPSNAEATGAVEPTGSESSSLNGAQDKQALRHLPKPSFYPTAGSHISQRAINAPKTVNIMKSLDVEDFKPADSYDFGEAPPSAMTTRKILPPLALTPRFADLGAKSKEMLERDLVELHTFTKVEQQIDTEWNQLNEKLTAATAQIDELQAERQTLLQRVTSLQAQVVALTASKQEADAKIAKYEEEVKTLRESVKRMDMENRAAVELEFQFESHKSKTKRRETELLAALSEKDVAYENLQQKLNDLSRDVLQNSKEDLMRSICPGIENNCEQICKKCAELERLLEEYKDSKDKSNAQAIDCECEQLRADIATTREQLEQVQAAYQQMSNNACEKSELCERLTRDITTAEEAKAVLQDQYVDLEQRQGEILRSMQKEYDAIQEKYQKLQQDYELLQQATAASEEQHNQLESENEHLQSEIGALKQTVQHMQKQLMNSLDSGVQEEQLQQLRTRNEQLLEQLSQMEAKYGELQTENDDLSNQLMESVQDGDSLRKECHKLREQLNNPPPRSEDAQDHMKLKAYIAQLEAEVAEKNLLIETTERNTHDLREQMQALESALLEKSVIVNQVEDYQRQLESLEKQHADLTIVCEELQEKVKENTLSETQCTSSSISTLLNAANDSDSQQELQEMQRLRERIGELDKQVLGLQAEIKEHLSLIKLKDELISKLQTELQERTEHCMSMDLEQLELRSNAQQQQQLLDRQADKLKDDASRIDQLQEQNAQLNENIGKVAENIRKEFEMKEKQQKELINSLQLEYLQKIEERENESRETLRKYNHEWATKLQNQVATTEQELGEKNAHVQELIREKHELESRYDDSEKLVKQLRAQLNSKLETTDEEAGQLQEVKVKFEQQVAEYEQLKREYELNLDKVKQDRSAMQSVIDENLLLMEELNQQLQLEQSQMQHQPQLADDERIIIKNKYRELVDMLTAKWRNCEQELQLGKTSIDEFKLEIESLRQQLQDASSKCTIEAEAKEEALKEVALLKLNLESHKEELSLKQNSLQTELEQLQGEQEKCQKIIEGLEASVEAEAGAKAEFMQQVESLRRALKAQQDALSLKNTSLQSVIDDLKQELKEAQEERNKLCVELAAYASAKAEHVEQIETLKIALNSQQDELSKSMQSTIDNLKQHLKEEEKRCAQLADEVTGKTELMKQLKTSNCQRAELQSVVDDLKQELDELREGREKLYAELAAENVAKNEFMQQIANLNLGKNSLQSAMDSLTQKLGEKQEECDKISAELADVSKAKQELVQQIETLKFTINELNEKHQYSSDSLQVVNQELQAEQQERKKLTERTTELLEQINRLSSQQEELNVGTDSLKSVVAEKNTQIEHLNQKLQVEQEKCLVLEKKLAAESGNLNSLVHELEQAKVHATKYERLLAEHDKLILSLSKANDANTDLTEKMEHLQGTLLLTQEELTAERGALIKLQSELDALLAEMSTQAQKFEQQLHGSKEEFNLQVDALVQRKLELEETNHQLTVKLKNELNLQNLLDKEREQSALLTQEKVNLQLQLKSKEEASNKLQQEFASRLAQLQSQLKSKEEACDKLQQQFESRRTTNDVEANKKSIELGQQVITLQAEIEKLRSQLKSSKVNFEASRERLDATISSLLEDKRNLEEKLCITNDIVKKLEADLRAKGNSSTNVSFDSNASSTSPSARRSLDREPPQPRKSLSFESEIRRNRRISTHDERRRQSYWNDSRHVACMTDPVDKNCNCAELDKKLKECQYELFISGSKVTALTIELKNHPLKEENAQLKKRLQEEQQRARDELKRIRHKNLDLMSKMNSLTVVTSSKSSQDGPTKPVATVETQTDFAIEEELKKTNDKLLDCMQICRHRFNHIKQLEEKLKQNENNDTSNISSVTAGHINLLKAKVETQKKEINSLTNKYEYAKKALKLRKEEIDELRRTPGSQPTPSSN